MYTIFIVFLSLLIWWDYLKRRRRNSIMKSSKIVGRRELPLLGSALYYRNLDSENLINFMHSTVQTLGKTYYSWIFYQFVVFCADIKDLEVILNSSVLITKNLSYDMLRCWLNDGLLILEQFVEIFDRQSTLLVHKLQTKADGKTAIDIFPLICLTALDIIAESAMGVKVNAQQNPDFGYVKAVKEVTEIISERLRTPIWRVEWVFRFVAPKIYKKMMRNIKEMHDFTNKVIQERRVALEKSIQDGTYESMTQNDNNDVGLKKRMALLDVLLQSTVNGNPLSNEDIREEVDTFMFEGHDTTTSGISFCLYLISRHADVQQKLFAEICEVMPDDTAALDQRCLQKLKYMECVLKESMRLYPPVPIIGRYFSEDAKINDKIIPADTHVNIPLFIILRDPDSFEEPDTFKPERFEGAQFSSINPFVYTPFSAGPRNCIGQKYAILEMKSTISKILRHFELLPLGDEVRPSLSIVMRSVNGMQMGLRPRTYKQN